jgi:hypothetical protein
MTYDYNSAGEQRSFDVIPADTVVVVEMSIRPGNAGEGGILKRTKNGDAEGLDAELTVVEGDKYVKRKFWAFMLVSGTTDGHTQAADITTRCLRAVLESARGIKPTDVSEAAKKARVAGYADFDGIRFMVKVGVEPARGEFKAKNIIGEVITPERREWHAIEQEPKPAPTATAATGNATPIAKPPWAQTAAKATQ